MAVVAGIKVKKKEVRVRNPLFADEKYTGGEPQWPEESSDWSDEQFDSFLRRSFNYYNYFYSQKDCKKYVSEWMKSTGKWTKDQIKTFDRTSDRSVPMTVCSLIMANRAGMQLRERHTVYVTKSITEAINQAEPEKVVEVAKAVETYKPTIQDRLAEKTSELIGELEGYYDEIDTNSVKFYEWFGNNSVVQNQLVKYENVFQKRKAELEEAVRKADPQLVEGYKHYKSADFKKRIKWIDDLLAAIEQYRGVKKAAKKARAKKAPSKEKIVSKLKFAKENKPLKIVSINPADIIGASELWIYNVKTRKLGKYLAASYQTLSVKGTSIVGFDADKSISKTLRKPEEQLKEFAKAGKVALRTFLKDIKAVETKLNGRIGVDILLLKTA